MVTEDGRIIPLVVLDREGTLVDAALINAKGMRKSLEHGALWVLHSTTGKLLPYVLDDASTTPGLAGLVERGDFAVATLEMVASPARAPGANRPGQTPEPAPERTAPSTTPPKGPAAEVVSHLIEVIRDRKEKMPEGSYTSYLFKEGSSKIRKKTGEEAVEVILSKDRQELTSETADLIYHLLVLLASENIPWEDVLSELEKRGR